jgi:hypothetical protein
MKVFLVLGGDPGDPCSDVMGAFSTEAGARAYVEAGGEGRAWWRVVAVEVDKPDSWEELDGR